MPTPPAFQTAGELTAENPPSQTYLVAVSGGRDSVVLLHWLLAEGYRSLVVCHLDHRLRPESDRDAAFVEKLAADANLPCFLHHEDISGRAAAHGESVEVAARNARYEFFEQAARKTGTRKIFLAHHADDQAETFLFNLLRGTGPAGLAAMRAVSTRHGKQVDLILLRPFLAVPRSAITAYAANHQLQFCEDATNALPFCSRNRIRLELLPQIEALLGRDPKPCLVRTAELLRAEDEYLRSLVPELPPELPVATLQDLPLALQRRYLHAWLKQHGIAGIDFDLVESVRSLLVTTTAKVNLPGHMHARRRSKMLFIQQPESGPTQ